MLFIGHIGMWLSLVEHYVRDVGAAGSNPVIPTIYMVRLGVRTEPFSCQAVDGPGKRAASGFRCAFHRRRII